MAQHFLLSSKACSLSLRSVLSMSEERAYAKFKSIRWEANGGKPVCPECGCLDHWELVPNRKWKCQEKACRLQFTVTSKTIFASRKMSFRNLLAAIAIFTNGAMGVAALRLRREVTMAYKTAFVLAHKLREAMGVDNEAGQMDGIVEIDGAVFGGSLPRLPNNKALWEEFYRKNKAAARKKRKLIVALRERHNGEPGHRPKVRTFIVEKEGDAVEIARRLVRPGAEIHADESTQWEPLHALFSTKRIKHKEMFSDGIACTNQAESFFSRMRRAERGVYNRISSQYLLNYGFELAWREEHSRVDNRRQFGTILSMALRSPQSRLAGYWQRHIANDNDGDELRRALGRS